MSSQLQVTGQDEVTVLVCDPSHSASKRIYKDAEGAPAIRGYNAGALFAVLRKPVANIRDLAALLLQLEDMPSSFVIRGAPVEGLAVVGVRRTKRNFATPKAGRRWALFDFDKIALPGGLDLKRDARAVIDYLVGLLPEEFRDSSYHYQLSSSAGFGDPRTVSAHIWFWLTEPWTDEALKLWAKALNRRAGYKLIDTALFNDVQAHYTAAPIFDGVENPFPVRSALVEKANDAIAIRVIETPAGPSLFPSREFEPGPGFQGWLTRIGDHAGGEGFHEPIIRAIASYVATHGREATEGEKLFEIIRDRVLAADRSHHDDGYVQGMASREHIMPAIQGALDKYGDGSARRKARLVPGMAPHYGAKRAGEAQAARASLDKALRSVVRTVPWRSG